jgi:hypothetical protein
MVDNPAIWLLLTWLGGALFFAARAMNLYRLILNNLAPGKTYVGVARVPNLGINLRRTQFACSAS